MWLLFLSWSFDSRVLFSKRAPSRGLTFTFPFLHSCIRSESYDESHVAEGLFSGYNDGAENGVTVSHLHFTNDTLLIGKKSWANIRSLKVILILFDVILGFKVNFQKSQLVWVNVSNTWLVEASTMVNCKT